MDSIRISSLFSQGSIYDNMTNIDDISTVICGWRIYRWICALCRMISRGLGLWLLSPNGSPSDTGTCFLCVLTALLLGGGLNLALQRDVQLLFGENICDGQYDDSVLEDENLRQRLSHILCEVVCWTGAYIIYLVGVINRRLTWEKARRSQLGVEHLCSQAMTRLEGSVIALLPPMVVREIAQTQAVSTSCQQQQQQPSRAKSIGGRSVASRRSSRGSGGGGGESVIALGDEQGTPSARSTNFAHSVLLPDDDESGDDERSKSSSRFSSSAFEGISDWDSENDYSPTSARSGGEEIEIDGETDDENGDERTGRSGSRVGTCTNSGWTGFFLHLFSCGRRGSSSGTFWGGYGTGCGSGAGAGGKFGRLGGKLGGNSSSLGTRQSRHQLLSTNNSHFAPSGRPSRIVTDRELEKLHYMVAPSLIHTFSGMPLLAHHYAKLVGLQCDLVNFTHLAQATEGPKELLFLVGRIFNSFDSAIEMFKVCKVETVGDAYICAAGGPPLNTHSDILPVLRCAAIFREILEDISEKAKQPLQCRIGLHVGKVLGSILGFLLQRYHLFGRTMIVLDLLESTAPVGGIQISAEAYEILISECEDEHDKLTALDNEFIFRTPAGAIETGQLFTSKSTPVSFSSVGGIPYLVETRHKSPHMVAQCTLNA